MRITCGYVEQKRRLNSEKFGVSIKYMNAMRWLEGAQECVRRRSIPGYSAAGYACSVAKGASSLVLVDDRGGVRSDWLYVAGGCA
jgi:hypothetical protein